MADPQTAATCNSKHRARGEYNDFARYNTKPVSAESKVMATKDNHRQKYQVFSQNQGENIIQSC